MNTPLPRVTILCSKCSKTVDERHLEMEDHSGNKYLYRVHCHGDSEYHSIPIDKLYEKMEYTINAFAEPPDATKCS